VAIPEARFLELGGMPLPMGECHKKQSTYQPALVTKIYIRNGGKECQAALCKASKKNTCVMLPTPPVID